VRVAFDDMPGRSRVWVYQADRKLSEQEIARIDQLTGEFVAEWAAHGAALRSSHSILHNQFLIISVDEDHNKASGCSIDSSVNFVRFLEQKFAVSFTDRTNVAVLEDTTVRLIKLSDIRSSIESHQLTDQTLVFNNLVKDVDEWKREWVTPASNTWLKKYFA
jgi:hypothetical protein